MSDDRVETNTVKPALTAGFALVYVPPHTRSVINSSLSESPLAFGCTGPSNIDRMSGSIATRPPLRGLLIDLSGTIHIGSKAIDNAVHAIDSLRRHKIPFRFCSNTSKESTAAVEARLAEIGIRLAVSDHGAKKETWTSIGAVQKHLIESGVKNPYLILSDSAKDEIESLHDAGEKSPYDGVVVGLCPSLLNYETLNTAFRILVGENEVEPPSKQLDGEPLLSAKVKKVVPLIATHKAKYRESSSPPGLSLGPGPFVAALEYAAGVKADVLGKPSRKFFETVIGSFDDIEVEGRAGKIAIIGDDVEADLGEGAIELGLWRVLVRTGKYRPGDENKQGVTPPDEVHDSFASFVASVLGSPSGGSP
ncbi:hypothetical protein HGRIS_008922 [Hohenbuehelia grisea]|uniref:Haloacid dehalogenase-like hydrolase domain-containing protein 2 n=1 Tax=Hohenbuehelia grisea TaxID=104357 RepID=A0ABR3IZK0_9AGAR